MKRKGKAPAAGGVPLELRLTRLRQGLVSDERVVDARLGRMADMPLSQWFGEDRERLEELCRTVPGIWPGMRFGQAAALLWRRRSRPHGLEDVWQLLRPLLEMDLQLIKQTDGSAYYWGARI